MEAFTEQQLNQYVMRSYGRYPLAISHGRGAKLYDLEGAEYLDFVGGIATCLLGHAHPALVEAVANQMGRVHHVSNLYLLPEQLKLAKWLVEHSSGDKVFFCNSGAEANEAAIKLARKYASTKLDIASPVIITAESSFHGRTIATITATGQPKYQKGFAPLLPGFVYVPFNDTAALRAAVEKVNSEGRRLAGILLEPLQGEGGVRPGTKEFFETARAECNRTGALFMVDEVQIGMGRSGKIWGYEQLGVEPDVISSAKGLGGGVPIGAMIAKQFCDVFEPGDHASTYGGNPLACAAALAVTTFVERPDFLGEVQARGEQLRYGLIDIARAYPKLYSEVRGWGLLNGLVMREDAGIVASDIVSAAMKARLLLLPAGPNVLRFVPPLVVTKDEVSAALDVLREVSSKF